MSIWHRFLLVLFSVLVASCDLQPKISSIPDSVGDFISSRYPALLADPEKESEIYNSAASDYGIYDSASDYTLTSSAGDYVNYADAADYVLGLQNESGAIDETSEKESRQAIPKNELATDKEPEIEKEPESAFPLPLDGEKEGTGEDVLLIPDYVSPIKDDEAEKPDFLVVPEKQAPKVIEKEKIEKQVVGKNEKLDKTLTEIVVQKGDTLYSIAKKNNTSVQELAQINRLAAPYGVKVGQKLSLVKNDAAEKVDEKKVEKETKPSVKETQVKPSVVQKEVRVEKKPEPKKQTTTLPVENPGVSSKQANTKTITVGQGDTLYSVSRRYAVPVNDLAVMNNLHAPFELKKGQSLKVPNVPEVKFNAEQTVKKEPSVAPSKKAKVEEKKQEVKKETVVKPVKQQVKAKEVKQKKTVAITKNKQETKPEKKPQEKNTKKPDTAKTAVKPEKPEKKYGAEKSKISSDPKQKLPQIAARSSSKFAWPVRGKILSHYGAKSVGLFNDGINISAPMGTSVVAAENGVVAYAGNEVKGMGNLVIIQHADGWMTVYAHLSSMNVRRGARVTVGQKIGTVGKTGKVTQPQLHFEIRRGTKAYNPINYLKK